MSFNSHNLQQLAHLARIGLSETELSSIGSELEKILEFVDQLQEADVSAVPPMSHPLDLVQRLRPDRVTEKPEPELFQRNAPAAEQGLYLVPKVLENGS